MRAYRLWERFTGFGDNGPLKWRALRTRIRSTQALPVCCLQHVAASFDHWVRSGTDLEI